MTDEQFSSSSAATDSTLAAKVGTIKQQLVQVFSTLKVLTPTAVPSAPAVAPEAVVTSNKKPYSSAEFYGVLQLQYSLRPPALPAVFKVLATGYSYGETGKFNLHDKLGALRRFRLKFSSQNPRDSLAASKLRIHEISGKSKLFGTLDTILRIRSPFCK